MDDPYKILGVSREASPGDIKKAFRDLSKKYHPDKNPGNKDAEDKFKELSNAYGVLSNPQKRAEHDSPNNFQFNPFGGGFGFGDVNRSRRQHRPNPNAPRRGGDLRIIVDTPLDYFILGGGLKTKISYDDICVDCKGSGATKTEFCSNCNGVGVVTQSSNRGNAHFMHSIPCGICHGKGAKTTERCGVCSGSGRIHIKDASIEVDIPKRAIDGLVMVKEGEGGKGVNGGPNGNLLIKLQMIMPKAESLSDKEIEVLRNICKD